jgi:hypothetical protein
MRPFWARVCGASLVVVSFLAMVGMPPSELKPDPSELEAWLSRILLPVALSGMAAAVVALGATIVRRPRTASYSGVACLLSFLLAAFAADRISTEGGWANTGVVSVLFLPFVLGLYSIRRGNSGNE